MITIISIIVLTLLILFMKFSISNAKKSGKDNLPKNIRLSRCPSDKSDDNENKKSNPLIVLFAWINAKDRNLDKFRELWVQKGFDVLTVRTSVFEALMPQIGSQIVAKNLVEVLSDLNSEYNEIIIHAFSVGGYQFGEVLVQLTDNEKHSEILKSFKGFIMDSIVFAGDRAPGMSRTLTSNAILQPIIERSMNLFFKMFHNLIVKHYDYSETLVVNPPIDYHGLIFYSKNDMLSSYKSNENLVQNWLKRGHKIRAKSWDESNHVQHYKHFQEEYNQELDDFVKSLNLQNHKIFIN